MVIDKIDNNKIVITLSGRVDRFGLQRLINYSKYLEATANSTAKQTEIDKIADEVNSNWYEANKGRFIK